MSEVTGTTSKMILPNLSVFSYKLDVYEKKKHIYHLNIYLMLHCSIYRVADNITALENGCFHKSTIS